MNWACHFRKLFSRLVGTAVLVVFGICGAPAQVPPQVGKDVPSKDFSILSIPPGAVVYKTLAELPESARASVLRAGTAGVTTQKTSEGMLFRIHNVDETVTTMIERKRERVIRLTIGPPNAGLPNYLSRSSFGTFKNDAMRVEKSASNGATLNAVYVFSSSNGLYLLQEWNYVADGGSVMRVVDFFNAKVNDIPAVFSVFRAPSGVEVRELNWVTDSSAFNLYYKGSGTNEQAYLQMLGLARSLGGRAPPVVEPIRAYPEPPIPFGAFVPNAPPP
jgi:hypothetical protein